MVYIKYYVDADCHGFQDRPSWDALGLGARPQPTELRRSPEPGEWPHGWQYYACDALETYFRTQGPGTDAGSAASPPFPTDPKIIKSTEKLHFGALFYRDLYMLFLGGTGSKR